jgi:hypothetical protein
LKKNHKKEKTLHTMDDIPFLSRDTFNQSYHIAEPKKFKTTELKIQLTKDTVIQHRKGILLLGMNYDITGNTKIEQYTDTIRMNTLYDLGYDVVGLSQRWSNNQITKKGSGVVPPPHIDAYFQEDRFFRHMKRYYTLGSLERISMVILDYFWLEIGYYTSNYGLNWPAKCRYIFQNTGAKYVIIPVPITNQKGDPKQESQHYEDFKKMGQGFLNNSNPIIKIWGHDLYKNPLITADRVTDNVLRSQYNNRHSESQLGQFTSRQFWVICRDPKAYEDFDDYIKEDNLQEKSKYKYKYSLEDPGDVKPDYFQKKKMKTFSQAVNVNEKTTSQMNKYRMPSLVKLYHKAD